MSRPAAVAVALLLVLTAVPMPAALAATGGGADARAPPPRLNATQQFDSTEFRIRVAENGSARWTFVYKKTLENQSQVENFRDYAARFENRSTDLYETFRSRARALTAEAENVTGRSMAAEDFHRGARVETGLNDIGVVRMSFRWTNFATRQGDRVVVGDVFQDGLYIAPNQLLVFEHGPDLRIESATPSPATDGSDSITYRGERQFSDERPKVVYAPPETGSDSTPSATTARDDGGGVPMLGLFALALVAIVGVGAAYVYRSGALGEGSASTQSSDGDGGGGTSAAAGGSPEPAVSDEELLSDEDRVMRLLEENGGRMKQVNIVEETGWSKSKVSMLLSDMEEEDRISKLRIGRENVISVAGEEPDAAGSPFEDDGESEE